MSRKEYLDSLKEVTIGADIREKIAKVYGSVPEIILKILTKSPSPELFYENESRTLSVREVLNMEEDNGVPFKSKGIIPIADKGDNDFIVYDGQAKIWAMYNIADELLFDQKESFEDLFLA